MAVVNSAEGIMYGFQLVAYLFGVAIVSLIVGMVLGLVVAVPIGWGNNVALALGGIFAVMGMQAGSLGLGYKVVADGVYKGVTAAEAN